MKHRIVTAAILVVFLINLVWIGAAPVYAAGYVVDSSADDPGAHDADPGDFICADTYEVCTLRAAIEEANMHNGPHTITFNQTMSINIDVSVGPLPALNRQIKLDASGVWDSGGNAPGVIIHGGSGSFTGLMPNAAGCEIYGLYITAFNGTAVYITSGNNTIGGTGPGQRNIISGNDTGIALSGSAAQNNVIRNNYIGLMASGATSNPNGTGILLTSGASNNIIGGTVNGQSNFISGNTTNGIMIEGWDTDNNLLSSNGIGLTADMTASLPNGQYGVRIQNGPSNTYIGGANNAGNFFVYSGVSGVYIGNAGSGTDVSWNVIGSNTADGISIYDTAGCLIHNNIISGNTIAGVRVYGPSAAGNLIWPNSITGNSSKGIILQNGGNMNIATPTIDSVSTWGASGTACASCRVALYSDKDDEGQVYHDLLLADSSGNWSYVGGPLSGPNLTATAIDISGNTSEFSVPVAVSWEGKYKIYMPFISSD